MTHNDNNNNWIIMTFNRKGIVLKVATKKTFENERILLAEFFETSLL